MSKKIYQISAMAHNKAFINITQRFIVVKVTTLLCLLDV